MNIKVDLKKLFAAAVSAIMCLSAGGCYLLPDEEEVLDAPTVKASDVTYSTVTAKKKDLEKKIVATGTVTAENQYTLSYEKQSGTVSKFYVKAGDKVKKGDVICDLDTYDLDYQIEEKQLYLEKAKLNVDIIYEGGGSQAEIDSAYVDVQLLEKELEKLQAQKEDSSLKSPIDGVVSSLSDVRAGDNVNPRADGSGFGLIAVALSISSCACRLARRAAKNFSTCSAAAFLFAVSLVSVIVSGSADCFGFVGAVTVCVGFGSVFGTTGFGASISISGVTFAADSFSCISAICSAMRSGVKSAPRVSALVNFC